MITFTKLFARHFMPYKRVVVPLEAQGLVRIEGDNMAGKTSILDALCWCLFAKTTRGVTHDAVVNTVGRKNCLVRVWFRVGREDYSVVRYRKHHTFKNRVMLLRGRQSVSFRHEEDTQAQIEKVLGFDFTTFSSTVVLGGSKPFAALSDAEKKKVLESFLHFEAVDKALDRTKTLLSKTAEELHQLELSIVKYRGEVNTLKAKSDTEKKAETNAKEEIEVEKKGLERQLATERSNTQTSRIYKSAKTAFELSRRNEEDARQASIVLRHRWKDVRDTLLAVNDVCVTCGQSIPTSLAVDQLRSLKARRKRLWKKWRVSVKVLWKAIEIGRKKETRLRAFSRKKDQREQRIESAEYRLRKLIARLSRAAKQEDSTTGEQYATAVKNLLAALHKQYTLRRLEKDLKFWVEGFGNRGIKAMIVRDALPAMNEKLEEYAEKVFDKPVTLKFLPAKETKSGNARELFHVHYAAKHRTESYAGESSGGRRRIDICVLLVFTWLSRNCNLLLVDELLDGLDESGRERALEILAELRGTVLCISHYKSMKAKFGRVWNVTREGKFSKLEIS